MKRIFAYILSLAFLFSVSPAVVYAQQDVAVDESEDDEEDTVELTSAVITALSCAKEAEESGEFEVLSSCPPIKAWEGVEDIYTQPPKIVVFDVTEGEYYYVQASKDSVYYSDLLEGFGGSIDGEGSFVGEKDGIKVVKFEEFEITPKPKPGFFKGCL
ncbi:MULTISPECIES: hypothetical protein [Persephonella]|uniref:Lipoprotein n=1 Tax=Persephonella marina (strain DSM 14350 / EX-H1) TaxID=123214 RepID=C0QP53_PERMH|nr:MULTISPECIES: hypothetical protein [Persephonella]ACO03689.1 hypothetical protein PERMA_0660 [Persephonella marina EX-H1]